MGQMTAAKTSDELSASGLEMTGEEQGAARQLDRHKVMELSAVKTFYKEPVCTGSEDFPSADPSDVMSVLSLFAIPP